MRASVIIVTHAGAAHLDDSLASLAAYAGRSDVEVLLVDNASIDGCAQGVARRYPWLRLVRSERNLGFAGGVQLGAASAVGDVLVLLNDDAAAEDHFIEAHLETLGSWPDAAASAGRLVSWDGTRHDYLRGRVTFDGHAFQVGQGWPVGELELPSQGEALPFACGGNMAIRREDWQRTGGFDGNLFAYFEDVELGWRLWAMGRQVVATPSAVARHHGAATSVRLGDLRRGVLYERNALRTFFGCADDEMRGAFGTVVLVTFLHRMVAFAGERSELASAVADPFGGAPPAPSLTARWRRRLREDGVPGSLRHLAARMVIGRRAGAPTLDEGLLLMQLRAAHGFLAGLDDTEARRADLGRQRVVPDREIVTRFPRLVVPTYVGDDPWFSSDAFRSLLPEGWPIESKRLEEIIHQDLL